MHAPRNRLYMHCRRINEWSFQPRKFYGNAFGQWYGGNAHNFRHNQRAAAIDTACHIAAQSPRYGRATARMDRNSANAMPRPIRYLFSAREVYLVARFQLQATSGFKCISHGCAMLDDDYSCIATGYKTAMDFRSTPKSRGVT